MKIFLTGGTGFIGSHILMKLLEKGHQVTVLARNKNKIPALHQLENLSFVEGSIGDYSIIKQAVPGHDACIHVALFWGEPGGYQMLTNDTAASVFLADVAAKSGCKHFIYTSSTAVDDYFYMVPEEAREDKSRLIPVTYKQKPATYYGATKAATENFLLATSYETSMAVNIVRLGYTFGNPIIEGAPTQGDNRFKEIALLAKQGRPIDVIKNDGTQFIWAGHLAEIYLRILQSDLNRKTYFGLSERFVSWHEVAKEAIKAVGSQSVINVIDKGYSNDPVIFDVSNIKNDFGLAFNPMTKIIEHIKYYQENFNAL
jgi:Nucleoside-diphosphate-sugar epimerases